MPSHGLLLIKVIDTGDKLFTGVNDAGDKFIAGVINPCHGFSVIASVVDTGDGREGCMYLKLISVRIKIMYFRICGGFKGTVA